MRFTEDCSDAACRVVYAGFTAVSVKASPLQKALECQVRPLGCSVPLPTTLYSHHAQMRVCAKGLHPARLLPAGALRLGSPYSGSTHTQGILPRAAP